MTFHMGKVPLNNGAWPWGGGYGRLKGCGGNFEFWLTETQIFSVLHIQMPMFTSKLDCKNFLIHGRVGDFTFLWGIIFMLMWEIDAGEVSHSRYGIIWHSITGSPHPTTGKKCQKKMSRNGQTLVKIGRTWWDECIQAFDRFGSFFLHLFSIIGCGLPVTQLLQTGRPQQFTVHRSQVKCLAYRVSSRTSCREQSRMTSWRNSWSGTRTYSHQSPPWGLLGIFSLTLLRYSMMTSNH